MESDSDIVSTSNFRLFLKYIALNFINLFTIFFIRTSEMFIYIQYL